jgi:hypothetical protein
MSKFEVRGCCRFQPGFLLTQEGGENARIFHDSVTHGLATRQAHFLGLREKTTSIFAP